MILFLKGIIIGIGKIIPGVSGSVLAISLNEYKNIINSINNIINKNNIIYLLKIGLGILLSIVIGSKAIIYFLDKNLFLTMIFFIGLIIGGIPSILKKVKKQYYLLSLIGFILLILINNLNIECTLKSKGLIIGIIESISTIIPGISGTAILTNLGLYNEYLSKWAQLYQLGSFTSNIAFFIPFLASLLITSILLIQIIKIVMEKYPDICNSFILGFILGSLYLLISNIISIKYNILIIIKFITILFIGIFIGYKLDNI